MKESPGPKISNITWFRRDIQSVGQRVFLGINWDGPVTRYGIKDPKKGENTKGASMGQHVQWQLASL